MSKPHHPKQVRDQANAANRTIEKWKADKEHQPRRGAPRTPSNECTPPAVITAPSLVKLHRKFRTLATILGPRACNKRWGRIGFYADLMGDFEPLQALGITLPGNKSLSAAACSHGLADTLRKHGHTRFTNKGLLRSGRERRRIAKKLHSAFMRVRCELKKHPPKDR